MGRPQRKPRPMTARQRALAAANLSLVRWAVRRLRDRGKLIRLSAEEAVAEGNVGLCRAAQAYRDDRGVSFSTYAVPAIFQAVMRADREAGVIRVPENVGLGLCRRSHGQPSDVPEAHLAAAARAAFVMPLHQPQLPGGESAADLLVGRPEEDAGDGVDRKARAERLAAALKSLPPAQAELIRRRWLAGGGRETLDVIGAAWGCSKENVRQAERRACRRLAELLADAPPP